MEVGGLSSLIMATTGGAAAVAGVWLSRRGQKEDADQETKATALAERVQAFDEMEALVDRLTGQLARADRALEATEVTDERRSNAQTKRCRDALDSAVDTIRVLQSVVRDEIAREAARTAEMDAERHTATDHPEDD